MGTNRILLGFEIGTGKPVEIPLAHTVITGMTQLAGKTTTIEALIYRSGLRAIVFKTKRGEKGFETAGKNLPMFFQERGDWQYVASLMEATLREKLKFERSWIIKITKAPFRTDHPLKEVYDRLSEWLKSKKLRGIDESIYTNLQAYLDIVLPKLAKLPTTNKISIEQGVNVMDLERIAESPEIQALIIRSVMEHILESESNVIVVVPECWKFLPQGKSTPVKVFFESFIRQGAAIGNFLWLDTQDLGGMDKTELRSVNNWILGRQRESNEVQRTLDQIPLPKGKKPNELDIMNLKIGHFYAACGDEVKLTYVLPADVPEDLGREIAMGRVDVQEAVKVLEGLRGSRNHRREDEDEMWKAKYDELEKKYNEAEGLRRAAIEHHTNAVSVNEELKQQIAKLTDLIEQQNKEINQLTATAKVVEPFKQFIASIMPSGAVSSGNSGVKAMKIQGEELTLSIEKPAERVLEYKATTVEGKLMNVIAFESKGQPMAEKEIIEKAAERGWKFDHGIRFLLSNLVDKGILIQEGSKPSKFRLPSRIKIIGEEK